MQKRTTQYLTDGRDQCKDILPLQEAFDKFCPNPKFEKVFASKITRQVPSIFGYDGYFHEYAAEVDSAKILVIHICDGEMKESRELQSKNCKTYLMTYEEYKKLPYEISDTLQQILNT